MHRNVSYGASRLFIDPRIPLSMEKKSPQICSIVVLSATSQASPRSALRRKKTYLSPIDSKKRTPLVVLRRGGSRRCRLRAVVLYLQAHVSSLIRSLFLLSSHSPVSPRISLPTISFCSLPLLIFLSSLPIFLLSPEKAERDREGGDRAKRDRRGRE